MVIGIVIAIIVVALFVATPIYLWYQYDQEKPRDFIEAPYGFRYGIRWRDVAVQPWPGLENAVHAMQVAIIDKYGEQLAKEKRLLDFWIDVYPKNAALRTPEMPNGTFRDQNGKITQAAGTISFEGYFMGLVKRLCVLVVQIYSKREDLPDGTVWYSGELLPADRSRLFHEVACHVVPYRLTGNANAEEDPKWEPLAEAMHLAYSALTKAERAA